PIGDGRPGHSRLKNIRTAQHCQRRHVTAERPASDSHAFQVQFRELLTERLQSGYLVFEWNRTKPFRYGPLPISSATRGASVIERNDDETLIRQPLVLEPGGHGSLHDVGVRASIHAHD